MRDINIVINKILKVVPKTEKDLINSLKWIADNDGYLAPEIKQESFIRLCNLLNERLDPSRSEWEKEIQLIIEDKK